MKKIKIEASIVTKLAMRKLNIKHLYDKELEKRILKTIQERKERARKIKTLSSPIDLL